MAGKTNLSDLLAEMNPSLNHGRYVFVHAQGSLKIDLAQVIATFREEEGITIVLEKEKADELGLIYDYVSAWITLTVHSSLDAVGLTAAFSKVLAENNISCNVMAAYYHDHIFVNENDAEKAMETLGQLTSNPQHLLS